ncbi:hypothetical protein C8Q73DRAFT_406623 [Cubamyces lactineus]|nr:hypothetical protein C8Q73DRAFT_406623 [Cubamyces lactineus]
MGKYEERGRGCGGEMGWDGRLVMATVTVTAKGTRSRSGSERIFREQPPIRFPSPAQANAFPYARRTASASARNKCHTSSPSSPHPAPQQPSLTVHIGLTPDHPDSSLSPHSLHSNRALSDRPSHLSLSHFWHSCLGSRRGAAQAVTRLCPPLLLRTSLRRNACLSQGHLPVLAQLLSLGLTWPLHNLTTPIMTTILLLTSQRTTS